VPMELLISQIATLIILISIEINHNTIPFNVDNPDIKIELSRELEEISGLTWYKGQLGAVQDEAGILYLINSKTGLIEEKVKFSLPGDFEGIEVVDETFYALTSGGTLFSFTKKNPELVKRIKTKLSRKNDTEGLAYDVLNRQLLVIAKENGSTGDYETKHKAIYAVSLDDYILSKKPIAKIKKSDLKNYIKVDSFKPSAIAVDPLTQDLYVLASVGKLLIVLTPDYEIKAVKKLSKKKFAQPEGICFSPDGDLFISNEGGNQKSNFYHLIRKAK
jgi:uncharacterized protein YjiK